jgi:predicted DNA-binding protein (MmcQ/YjbR family)
VPDWRRGVTPAAFEKAALALPGAVLSIQFGAERVYKVGGKMFAMRSHDDKHVPVVSFKASDVAFELLTEREGVIPAPYLARAKWVALETLRVIPDAEIKAYLKEAHRLVAEKLPKKLRAEILGS